MPVSQQRVIRKRLGEADSYRADAPRPDVRATDGSEVERTVIGPDHHGYRDLITLLEDVAEELETGIGFIRDTH